ncbi:MAG: flagellar hook-associated protein FlgK [Clostridiaceae bacterium]|nr:flagellar hook-associated protein FlgK [Clostridiaceae bacterium]
MSISFFGFDTAVSGLTANQRALEVTGHNVANLGTSGYSRQNTILASAYPRTYGNWRVEMGVDIQQIRQIRHTFNDNIYRAQSNNLGYWEARSKAVKDIESILGEPMMQGFQAALNNFWDAFQELSKAPESLTVRALVRQRADSLVKHLNQVGSKINKLQSDLNEEIRVRINEVNDITEQIAELNIKIMSAEAAGNLPNDYYDMRNVLADRLSVLVNAEFNFTPDGSMDVLVGGYYLVNKGEASKLAAVPNDDLSNFYTPVLKTLTDDIPIELGQGIIRGLLEARGEVSGAKGSYSNGTPNITSDITIAIDISNTSTDYLAKVKDHIDALVNDLELRGLDYNLRLVTFGGSSPVTNTNFRKDAEGLKNAIPDTPDSGTSNNFEDVINAVASNEYGEVNKYLLVFTEESINGDGAVTDDDTLSQYLRILKDEGITLSVSTNPAYFDEGDTGEKGWDYLTSQTGGKLYDSTEADYTSLMKQISHDVNYDINTKMSTTPDNLNIISSVRKQLNALINILAREVNRLHMSGKTLTGKDGGLFFEAIDNTRPIELGNIKLSDDLLDVNNIAASTSDANGDNRIALAIANLRHEPLMTGNNKVLSLDTFYQFIILDIGNKGYEAESMSESYRMLVQQADNMRQSVMGVSLDEEMTNMIKYKYAYNANSRLINVIDQMLETVIFHLGSR